MKKYPIIGIAGKKGSGKDSTADAINKTLVSNGLPELERVRFADTLKDMTCLVLGCTREQLEDEEFKNSELGPEWWLARNFMTTPIFGVPEPKAEPYDVSKHSTDSGWIIIKLKVRDIMQMLGTNVCRSIHPNFHVNCLLSKVHSNTEIQYIVPDVRFPNELSAVENEDGIVLKTQKSKFIDDTKLGAVDKFGQGIPVYAVSKEGERALIKYYSDFDVKGVDKYVYETFTSEDKHPSETALDDTTFEHVFNTNGTLEELEVQVKSKLIELNITKE